MPAKTETLADVERWFREQRRAFWPAALGSLSLRRSPCIRPNCAVCLKGEKHPSYVLYCRIKGRRSAIYIPQELVPQMQRCLDNGRALQELLHEAAGRYTTALKHERTKTLRKAKNDPSEIRRSALPIWSCCTQSVQLDPVLQTISDFLENMSSSSNSCARISSAV